MADNKDDVNAFTSTSTKVLSKKHHSVKYCQVDLPKLASLDKCCSQYESKVPDQIASSQDGKLPSHLVSQGGACTEKFAQKYTTERRIAYAEMARTSDGSAVLLEESSDGHCVVPGWDYIDVMMSNDSENNTLPFGNINNLHIRNLNYADIDFLPTEPRCQADLVSSSRTKYACIDLNRTLAISKAGKELLQEKIAIASNKCKPTSNYSIPLKKASSCFYVSMPIDHDEPLTAKDNLISKTGTVISKSKKKLLSPKPQRKLSFDFAESSRYPNTLPHSKKKFN